MQFQASLNMLGKCDCHFQLPLHTSQEDEPKQDGHNSGKRDPELQPLGATLIARIAASVTHALSQGAST